LSLFSDVRKRTSLFLSFCGKNQPHRNFR